MVCIVKGYKCILAVSDKTKPEKIAYLKHLAQQFMFALLLFLQMTQDLIMK
jgi:hypothetical protein